MPNWRAKFMTNGTIQSKDLAYRPPLYAKGFPFVLLWSQKAACTTVTKWFFAQIGVLKRALNHHRWVHNFESDVFKAREGYLEDCAHAINNGVEVLKFVRNPYTRIYSGYLETCSPRVFEDREHWSSQTRNEILGHLVGLDVSLEYGYSFSQFVDWLATKSRQELDPHLAPQFEKFERRLRPKIIRLEDSANVFHDLEAENAFISTIGRRRIYESGHHHEKVSPGSDLDVGVLDLALPVRRSSAFAIYDVSPDLIASSSAGEKIRTIFKQDFDAYGYQLKMRRQG